MLNYNANITAKLNCLKIIYIIICYDFFCRNDVEVRVSKHFSFYVPENIANKI